MNLSLLEGDFLWLSGLRLMFNIQLRCGRARVVKNFSQNPDEGEVLIPPNTPFMVNDIQNMGAGLTIVYLTELPSKDPIVPFGIVHKAVSEESIVAAVAVSVSASSASNTVSESSSTQVGHLKCLIQ